MLNSYKPARIIKATIIALVITHVFPAALFADTVGVFFNMTVPQDSFAAYEVKAALESRGFTADMQPLASLNASYANRKVVIAQATNTTVTAMLTSQGGTVPTGLGEQAYALRTTTTTQFSYWTLGGDVNGSMYGGLQIAESIKFNGLAGIYNSQESPTILKRGIKLNLPWDRSNPTYGKYDRGTFDGTSSQLAIKDVWDMTFWTAWFDEMAHNRYNVISLWSCNPFSSLISVPGYENVTIQNVTYFDGTVKVMTLAEKITFWRQVMAYAHARGFEFLLFNWNVFTYGANGQYGITDGGTGANDPDTRDYMYKAMYKLLETYPDFDGFGFSLGENGGTEDFCWFAYGKAIYDYALAHPQRKLRVNHRLHYGNFSEMLTRFAPLRTLSNVTFQTSVKHSQAFMYSTAVPNWWPTEYAAIRTNNLSTWCEVRNDAFYYLTWGDPNFARAYVNGMLGLGSIFSGFVMGWDGYNPTRTFFSKNSVSQGGMEIKRQQYNMMLFGRLSYNPNISDDVFKNHMAVKYPTVSSDNLFTAWSMASKGPQLAIEIIQGTRNLDYKWYPEANTCAAGRLGNPADGFIHIAEFMSANPPPGSNMCSIANSASGSCGSRPSSYRVADSIRSNAQGALSLISGMSAAQNSELGVALTNIRGLSYLGLYYAEKIRGATYSRAGQAAAARDTMGRAYCNWMTYANLMDANFTGMQNQRVDELTGWHMNDAKFLKEYTDLGGSGTPSCLVVDISTATSGKTGKIFVKAMTGKQIIFHLPSETKYSLSIFTASGAKVNHIANAQGKQGLNEIKFEKSLGQGEYVLHLNSEGASLVRRLQVVGR